MYNKGETICWDCELACGGCPWSKGNNPVPGWNVIQFGESITVIECPLFRRDSEDNGNRRLTQEEHMRIHNRRRLDKDDPVKYPGVAS